MSETLNHSERDERWRCPGDILVANSFTKELYPVDRYVVSRNIRVMANPNRYRSLITERTRTIYDLLMAGF